MTDKRLSWNQPQCDDCWYEARGRTAPVRVKPEYAERQVCAYCGAHTQGGIFVRDNPENVKHPRWDED